MKPATRAIVAIVSALAVITAFYTWEHWPRPQVASSLGAAPNISPMGAYKDAPQAPTTVPTTTTTTLTQSGLPVIVKELTNQQRYDKLKNGNAQERMQAYLIVKGCLEPDAVWAANQKLPYGHKYPHPDTVANCGDLSPGVLQSDEERRALLIPAAKAGVKGAFAALMLMESPGGAMEQLGHPSIPEKEWEALMAEAKEAGKVTADPDAMEVQIARVQRNANATPEEKAKVIEYSVAAYVKRFEGQVPPMTVDEYVNQSPRVQALMKTLPPDIAQKAIAAGTQPRPKEFTK